MKISEETLSILGNLSSVHNSIIVEQGSVLSVVSEDKTLLVRAVVDETFPKTFAIYDHGEFLNATSLLGDSPVLTFEDDMILVESSDSSRTIRYECSDISLLKSSDKSPLPPGTIELSDDPALSFDLSNDAVKNIKKSAGVLNLPHVVPLIADGNVVLSVCDKSKKTKNTFDIDVSNVTINGGENIVCTMNVDSLKVLPGDYTVKIFKNGICCVQHKDLDLEYFIAPLLAHSSF